MNQYVFHIQEKEEAKSFRCDQLPYMELFRVVDNPDAYELDKVHTENYKNDIVIKIETVSEDGKLYHVCYQVLNLTKGLILDSKLLKHLRFKREWSVKQVTLVVDEQEKPSFREESK